MSIDNYSDWPEAMFLHKPTTQKVIDFLILRGMENRKIFLQIREQHLRAKNLRSFVNNLIQTTLCVRSEIIVETVKWKD